MALSKKNFYSKWSEYLGLLIGDTVSKVALWKRMNKSQVLCLQLILEETFRIKVNHQFLTSKNNTILFSPFGKVYIQDSTIISLPDELCELYKGSVSKGKQKSSIRIQAIYDLLSGCFREFSLGSFTENDQGAASDIVHLLQPGDLVIRDLGYFVLNVFKKIAAANAFFLSRFRYGINIYDVDSGKRIQLLDMLNRGILDTRVLIGADVKLECRIVAIKLPEHIVAERRRKAKMDRDKRLNHSKEFMDLLSWSIFITNIDKKLWPADMIMKAYRLRWHIEIIFKGWKSHFNIASLVPERPKSNRNSKKYLALYKNRIDSVIYMMLLFIIMFQIHIYVLFVEKIFQKYQKLISIIKLCSYIADHKERLFACTQIDELEKSIVYYATYEKRLKRKNHLEMYIDLFDYQVIKT